MSEFPLNDSSAFLHSATQFFQFLTCAPLSGRSYNQFWDSRIDLREYLQLVEEDELLWSMWHRNASTASHTSTGHTHGTARRRSLGAKSNVKRNISSAGASKLREGNVARLDEALEHGSSVGTADVLARHVTRDALSEASRAELLAALRRDAVFSPLLNLISDILKSSGVRESKCKS
mmetsp:Transcript_17900/g.29936  ORF Transcript_17900/g.29936 Transcript_17900/m.29936 type:complete len:177 (-) Transcript_17900:55-585(-)